MEIKIVLSKSGLHNLEEDDQALEMRTKLLMQWRLHEQKNKSFIDVIHFYSLKFHMCQEVLFADRRTS